MQKKSKESANEFFTKLAWAAMWTKGSDYYLPNALKNGIEKDGIKVGPMGDLQLGNVPASGSIQLMKSHNLIHWLPVKTGYVGIQFSDVDISKIWNMTNGGLTYTDVSDSEGKIVAKINTPPISITGKYVVVASGLAQCAIDAASILPGGLKAENVALATGAAPTPDQMTAAAREQRTKLWQTPNGGQMMDTFYEHNEPYNFCFQNNKGLQNSWSSETNQHFMGTTYQSSQNPDASAPPLNTGTAPDGTEYNKNAFNQKLAVAAACTYFYSNPPASSTLTKEQFLNAAVAAGDFQGKVGLKTGNVPGQPAVPMNVNQVYTAVSQGISEDEEKRSYVLREQPRSYQEFIEMLNDEDREYLDRMGFDMTGDAPEKMLAKSGGSATLIQGDITINITSGDISLGATLDFKTAPTQTATAAVSSFTSSAKIAQVQINNFNAWGSLPSIATSLIKAYNDSGQIASLMQDKINAELSSDKVKNYISTWLNNTLQKVFGNF